MKFILKDYQDDAVADVLKNLRKARKDWHQDAYRTAFSLTAATGAGKTVMAAAVFEALFHGDDDRSFDPDPGAVVIWFSDDPSLNEQTRFRLGEASDRLNWSDMVVVDNNFNRDRFERGKIYFLNTQKLSRNSLLVRGHDPADDQFPQIRPDLRSHTIWDTIQNTIEDNRMTLYLVLDEAHRGLGNTRGSSEEDKSTIVRRLINGTGPVPAIPVVWGISATVERFNRAMGDAEGRSTLPHVVVDPVKVQDSGLLKDTIILDVPDEVGTFDTVLIRRATQKLVELSKTWADYSKEQKLPQVHPLMVLQVRNTPDPHEISGYLDIVRSVWPDMPSDAIAHVFGDHTKQTFGRYEVPYIEPQRVQESDWVRVLIAKDAISTGWDCPRAEVMVSFRAARDATHITQLLGRMVRTPLARRIPGNDRLNSVDCLLPFFYRKSVEEVADALTKGGGDGSVAMPGRRVLINAREMLHNPAVPQEVWDKFLSLPSEVLPQRAARPVKRLTALAHELAMDDFKPNAGRIAHGEMHKVLDAAGKRYSDEIAKARGNVLAVEGVSLRMELRGEKTFDQFVEAADMAVIEEAYRKAAREFSPDVTKTYAEHLARQMEAEDEDMDMEDALIEAHTDIAAMGLVPAIREYLDLEADKLARTWFEEHRIAVKSLSDRRRESYREIQSMSTDPQDVGLSLPRVRLEPTSARNVDGSATQLPKYPHHLLCDADGDFPAELNSWEQAVLEKEMAREGFVAWYRNPSSASQDSLGVSYVDNDQYRIMRPDFLFFLRKPDGEIAVDIVDPHGLQFADALPKLKGLSAYAEQHGEHFRRIESIAAVGSALKVLDLENGDVRSRVGLAADADALFASASGYM